MRYGLIFAKFLFAKIFVLANIFAKTTQVSLAWYMRSSFFLYIALHSVNQYTGWKRKFSFRIFAKIDENSADLSDES
jgi:hypothetical protein